MAPEGTEQPSAKAALKRLREARKPIIEAAAVRLQEQQRAIGAIKGELAGAGKTVPELAAATGLPPAEVMWYVAALKKYGEVLEGDKDGSYFRYRLAAVVTTSEGPD